MTTTVTAAVVREIDGPFRFEELTIDEPRPDEVLVKITAVGLCHTDLAVQHGHLPQAMPLVPGHEGAGVVAEVGSAVAGIAVGDQVVISFSACGDCGNCLSGRRAYCLKFGTRNFSGARDDGSITLRDKDEKAVHGNFFGQSSFSTYVIASARDVVVLPDDAPLDIAGPLGCGIQTGAGSVLNSLGVSAGSVVAVSGTGSVGLAAVMAAKVAGATTIIAIDVVSERLEVAKSLGATHVINGNEEDIAARILQLTGDGVPYAVDTTGVASVIATLIRATALGGKIALVGVAKPGSAVDLDLISAAGKTVIGVYQGDSVPQRFIPEMLALHAAGQFPFDRLITRYRFDQINEAIADTHNGTTVKAVLVMP
ncbi:NAD(P)-dependent alcohol dehydrogenase [Nocardia carnea]|uniref:NAD(P)-dependent alcohol dehydrogenase n=1 Tax=Nocardia carnea TaxID=37328 RepID=UPI0024571979|nr:NAD(P)-dependent alcohol dehydrogenase [Nocardia carnea]